MKHPWPGRSVPRFVAIAIHMLAWVGCGTDDGAPPPGRAGAGGSQEDRLDGGDAGRDAGHDGGRGAGEVADAAADPDGDFGFDELAVLAVPDDAAADSGTDARVPELPDEFTCDEALLGDGTCDCGCGMDDPDCSELGCSEPGCFAEGCQRCYGGAGELSCARGNCAAGFKTNGDCDCGCREPDPECDGAGDACLEPSCSASGCRHCFDADGRELMCAGWLCQSEQPASGDGCNCGCGTADADCAPGDGCSEPGCSADGCTSCRTEDGAPMSCTP